MKDLLEFFFVCSAHGSQNGVDTMAGQLPAKQTQLSGCKQPGLSEKTKI
jgi:hypothetical protein